MFHFHNIISLGTGGGPAGVRPQGRRGWGATKMGSIVMEPDDIASYANIYNPTTNRSAICMSIAKMHSNGIFHHTNPLEYAVPRLLAQLSLSSMLILFTSCYLKPLGQPSMVPQILGGLILGPSFLGHYGGFTTIVFPYNGLVILDALATFGYMFYFFLIGVQVDPWILKKIEKKEFVIGISTVAVAMVVSITASFIVLGAQLGVDQNIAHSLPPVATMSSVLAFPIIAHYLNELKMVNTEFGRMALSSSMVSNMFGFCVITLTVLTNQKAGEITMFWTVLVGVVMATIILVVVRLFFVWLLQGLPERQPMTQGFISLVLVGVLMSGFCSKASGLHIFYGPLLYGMAIPPGPPLGAALVEKLDLITSWMFMPLYFMKNGLVLDIFAVKSRNYFVVQFIIFIACTGKFLGAFASSIYYKVPLRDAVTLGLVMNIQGVLELGMFKMMKQAKAIDGESFVVLCTSMLIVAATVTPLVRHLHDTSKRYVVYKRRTLLDSKPDSELRVLACIHDQENVPVTINILETIIATKRSPISIYVIHLVELVARANPLLISHKLTKRPSSKASTSRSIVNAFRLFEEHYGQELISVQSFTAISSYATMHDEVCAMALDGMISLIMVPFHRTHTVSSTPETNRKGIRIMNSKVLEMAPCTVAIVVDRGILNSSRPALARWSSYRVAVLFFGGADDREALALGARMAGQPNVHLTIVRLLENGQIKSDNISHEKNLDNEVVSNFRLIMAGNYQVRYIEEVVMDGTGTVSVIRSTESNYELLIVGRRHDTNSSLLMGLIDWHEETELGVIGDMMASSDFKGNATILVIQQQKHVLS